MAPFAPTPHLPRNSIGLSGVSNYLGHTRTRLLRVFYEHALDNTGVEIMRLILSTR